MSAAPQLKMTVAEYLTFELAAEFKHEYYEGEVFAMAGASREHNGIKENLSIRIGIRLDGGPCRSFSSDQRVRSGSGRAYSYPDLVIVCDRPEYDPLNRDTLINPQVIFEVLSPGTEAFDRGGKFRRYQKLPSLREYVMFSQDRMFAERYVRQPNGSWLLTNFDDPAGDFALASVPVRLPLADLYRGVDLPELPPDE